VKRFSPTDLDWEEFNPFFQSGKFLRQSRGSLEQGWGIGIPIGLGVNQVRKRLLISLLCVQK